MPHDVTFKLTKHTRDLASRLGSCRLQRLKWRHSCHMPGPSLCGCMLCFHDSKVICCHPLSVASAMAQQNSSVECCGYICCCWWGARAAVEKTEGSGAEETGTLFPTCPPPANAMSLIQGMWFVYFGCTVNKMLLIIFKTIIRCLIFQQHHQKSRRGLMDEPLYFITLIYKHKKIKIGCFLCI